MKIALPVLSAILWMCSPAFAGKVDDAVTKVGQSSRYVLNVASSGVGGGGPITGPLGAGVAATAVRITVASDSDPLSIDDGGGSITIDSATLATEVTLGTIDVDTGNIATSTASIDTDTSTIAGDTTSLDAKIITGGGAEVTAVLVTIANDSTGILTVDDGGGSLTVDGTVAATQSGTWNITNVSGTISLPTGAATETTLGTIDVDTGNIATSTASIDTDTSTIAGDTTSLDAKIITGGGAELGAVLVTIANNSTGILTVDDGGGSLTVDGTVAATQSGTWNITNISGTISLPTGAATETTLGTIDVDTGNIATSTASIDTDTSTIAGDTTSLDTKIVTGGGVETGAVLVTIASDSTGVLTVDDGGGSLTIDSTVLVDIEANTDTGDEIGGERIVVGTSATLVSAASATKRSVTIQNDHTTICAVGPSDVTLNTVDATDGWMLASGNPAGTGKGGILTLNTTAAVYVIGSNASSAIRVIVESD